MNDWLSEDKIGVTLRLLIQPKASRSEVVGVHGTPARLKIRIAAPPVDGEANEELLRFLKKTLKVKSQDLQLLRGHQSKMKDVFCAGLTVEQAKKALL